MQHIRHSKHNGRNFMHYPGLGAFSTPGFVQRELDAKSDEQLLDELHKGAFVDPFVMGEIMNRRIYHKVQQPKIDDGDFWGGVFGNDTVTCTCVTCGSVTVPAADVARAGGSLDCEHCGQPMETEAIDG